MSFNLSWKDRLLESREAKYKAECALADTLDVLSAVVAVPMKERADRVFCYFNLRGKNALFGAFFTEGDKALQYSDEMDKSEFMDLNLAVIGQLTYLREQYSECQSIMPSEIFMDYDPRKRDIHALIGMENFYDPYDAAIRFNAWLKEHGGEPKPAGPRQRTFGAAIKFRLFNVGAEEAHDPTANCTELDMKLLDLSRKYVSGDGADPALVRPGTGWDAVRAELERAYPGCGNPMSFENDGDLESRNDWCDIYDAGDCWHFVSCGISNMGSDAAEQSGDFEYTLRLKKLRNEDDDNREIFNTLGLFRDIVDAYFEEGKALKPYSVITVSDQGMDADKKSDKAGFILVPDKKLKAVSGPSGTVSFIELVAVTDAELQAVESGSMDAESLYKKLGSDITDYRRKSLV